MQSTSMATPSGLATLLRGLLADLQRSSGADIASIFLYDSEAHSYYAPFASGQPEEGMLDSLADISEQLARYLGDAAQGKAPADLHVTQYGSTVWLTLTKQPLIARDAQAEIDSTFVRRYRVESTLGLPLLADGEVMGLVYLNYCTPPGKEPAQPGSRLPDEKRLAELQREAARAGALIKDALAEATRNALEGLGRLAQLLAPPTAEDSMDPAAFRRRHSIALADLLMTSGLEAAVVYQFGEHRGRLELVSAHLPAAAPPTIELPEDPDEAVTAIQAAVSEAAREADLHPVDTFALESAEDTTGYLVVLSRDPLAAVRLAPATDQLLRGAAALIGGAVAGQHLFGHLEAGNRLLGALSRMTNAMLRPGSSRHDVLEAVVRHLTDASVPEFDFHFATVNLVEEHEGGSMVVTLAAGSTTSAAIASTEAGPDGEGDRARVPRWVQEEERRLAPTDVLVYVARTWRVAVVGGVSGREESTDQVLEGPIPEPFRWTRVPVVRADGTTPAWVPICLVGQNIARGGADGSSEADPPFTLAGEIFESSGHAELVRIFLPFGLDQTRPASGVLEVGYHRSSGRRPDWTQVEALRAAAAQVAVAVETTRLYEETRRHAERLELSVDVSRAIASSIDLDQTLRLVARNLARLVDASVCQIALYEEDGSGWYGAAASRDEELWRHQHGDRPKKDFLFEVLDRGKPLLIESVESHGLVSPDYARTFGVRSLLVLPLLADRQTIGAAILARGAHRPPFNQEEVELAQGLSLQAAVAIKNARLHALTEEERHIQKDFVLVGFGQWGQKAYRHLLTLKQFFNFRIHVVERDVQGARERLAGLIQEVGGNGDELYWDTPDDPAPEQLARVLEPSCYVITYIATPAPTHLDMLKLYYDLSDVVLIEKPLGAPPEAYREFLDTAPGRVEIVAADHYYFKLEVRLLQLLLTEERTLRDFMDSVEEVQIEILEAQPLQGAAAEIGVIADLVPHAFAVVSLLTPIDRIHLDPETPLLLGRHEPMESEQETYARINASFPYQGRRVRLIIDAGKGVEDAKWIKLVGEHRLRGRSAFYKFDFGRGEAVDGTQTNVRAATRLIREPGVPDNAHLSMLRHVIEKRRPAVGILAIREAIRSNQRIQELETMAHDLLQRGEWTPYRLGSRPAFASTGRMRTGAEPAVAAAASTG
jgi:GAF domain-containing protein